VFELTGSTPATGLTLTAESLPALLLGPVAGVFAGFTLCGLVVFSV
jgi:hypothetical protein